MNMIRRNLSLLLREQILRHYLIPYSRHGVPSAILRFLPKTRPISLIDVGASRGDFSRSLERFYRLKKALLIEPQPELYEKLKIEFKEPIFAIMKCALGDENRMQDMAVLNWDQSSSILEVRRDIVTVNSLLDLDERYRFNCQIRMLDDVIHEVGWTDPIDLLKLDVQGAELLVLRGAEAVLRQTRFIYAEVSYRELYRGSAVFHEVYKYLEIKGFKLITIADGFRGSDGELLQGDALFCSNNFLSQLPEESFRYI